MANKVLEQEQKLRWLIRNVQNSHYGCEYRQDGTERVSVRCGGCGHSRESLKRAEQAVVDFVGKLL